MERLQNRCEEDRELCLEDGTEKIFYNCACNPEKVPENLRELYDYIRTGKVGGDLTQRIEEAVCKARENEEWSNLVICQADFRNDFDMYFRKKGNFNRPIFKEKHRFV